MIFFKKLKTHVTRWFIGIFLVILIVSALLLQIKKSKANIPAMLLECSINQHQRKSNYLRCTYQFEYNNQSYLGTSERTSVTLPLLFWTEQARRGYIQSVKSTPQMAYYPSHSTPTHQLWLHETWYSTLISLLAVLTNIALFLMLLPFYLVASALRKKIPWLNRDATKMARKSDKPRPTSEIILHTVLASILGVSAVFGVLYFSLLIYLMLFNAP